MHSRSLPCIFGGFLLRHAGQLMTVSERETNANMFPSPSPQVLHGGGGAASSAGGGGSGVRGMSPRTSRYASGAALRQALRVPLFNGFKGSSQGVPHDWFRFNSGSIVSFYHGQIFF